MLKLAVLFLCAALCMGLQPGDRVSAMIQTLHNGWKTPFIDLPISQMPSFKQPNSAIVRISLPSKDEEPEMKLNPEEDVKISLTFSNNKLMIPWVVLFDAQHKRSLNRVVVTFAHDDFEVLSVKYKVVFGPTIRRLEPDHPALTAFEIVYEWQAVQEQDLSMGIFTLFLSALIGAVLMITLVSCTYDRSETTQGRGGGAGVGGGVSNKTSTPTSSARMTKSNSSSSFSSGGAPSLMVPTRTSSPAPSTFEAKSPRTAILPPSLPPPPTAPTQTSLASVSGSGASAAAAPVANRGVVPTAPTPIPQAPPQPTTNPLPLPLPSAPSRSLPSPVKPPQPPLSVIPQASTPYSGLGSKPMAPSMPGPVTLPPPPPPSGLVQPPRVTAASPASTTTSGPPAYPFPSLPPPPPPPPSMFNRK